MRIGLPALFCGIFLLSGCFPFGATQRTVAGDYRLERWEDGTTYYLHKRGHDDSDQGGSLIGGTVVRIGWNALYIVAERFSIFRGDEDGWMIVNVRAGVITGPFSDAELRKRPEVIDIATYPVAEAWSKL